MWDTEHVFVRGENGAIIKLDLPLHPEIEEQLRKGQSTRVANAEGDPFEGDARGFPGLPTEIPAMTAPKTDWVSWAVACGLALDAAQLLTKDDLIDRFGVRAQTSGRTN